MALYPHETEMAYLDDGNKWLCHGQAIKPEDATNLDVWGEKSNMTGFEFKTAPVLFFDEDADDVGAFPSKSVAYRSDTKAPIEVVGANYKIVQPKEVLNFFDSIINDMGYKMTSCGILNGGRRFWAQAMTGAESTIGKNDKVKESCLLATGFDGASVVKKDTHRMICWNQLAQAIKSGDRVSVSHRSDFNSAQIKDTLSLDPLSFKEWTEIADAMAGFKLGTKDDAHMFIGETLELFDDSMPDDESRLLAFENNKAAMAISELYHGKGAGSKMATAKGTIWGAVNAVTQYMDHERPTRTMDARFNGAMFGAQANIKQRAWDLAMLKVR